MNLIENNYIILFLLPLVGLVPVVWLYAKAIQAETEKERAKYTLFIMLIALAFLIILLLYTFH